MPKVWQKKQRKRTTTKYWVLRRQLPIKISRMHIENLRLNGILTKIMNLMNKKHKLKKCLKMFQRRMLFLVIQKKEGSTTWALVQKILIPAWADSLVEWVASLVVCAST
jgi:hypothetical protein